MIKILVCILFPAYALCITGCLSAVTELYPGTIDNRPVPVYIVQVGWHAGLVVESEYMSAAFPSHEYIPDSKYLKIGWGDDKYYPDPDPAFWILLRAVFWPSRSVLHVVGLNVSVEDYFSGSEVITLHISEKGMERMTDFIANYFRTDENNRPVFHADGRHGNSAFFKAEGRYYFPKTSNVWTARALRAAGVPITPLYSITAGNVMHQVSKIAGKDRNQTE